MAAYDDLNDKRIFTVAILSVVVVAVTALAVQVLYYWMVQAQERSTAAMSNYNRQNAALEAQDSEIGNFGVDPESASVMIPIDQAIDRVLNKDLDGEDGGSDDEENA
ncbi:MAG: hypothetical protein AAF958_04325 [Planctomycetota bacterium]